MACIAPEKDISFRQNLLTEREQNAQQGKVLDVLASVRMMQADIHEYGHVTPEVREQVRDEELTYVVEAIDLAHRTDYSLYMHPENGLCDVMGRSLSEMLELGQEAARSKAEKDGREYVYKRAVWNHIEGQRLNRMMADNEHNVMVSFSPFPQEAYGKYGKKTLEEDGYQPGRKLGFIYVYTKLSDTELRVTTMSVDNCDLDVVKELAERIGLSDDIGQGVNSKEASDNFQQYYRQYSLDTEQANDLPSRLLSKYDEIHERHFGVPVKAGRAIENEPSNGLEFANQNMDLVNHYLNKIENLALHNNLDIKAKEELTYSFWAAMNDRLKGWKKMANRTESKAPIVNYKSTVSAYAINAARLDSEMRTAMVGAMSRQEKPTGCGGSISGMNSDGLASSSPLDTRDNIFSDKAESKANWKWKKGVCVVEKCSTRPGETEVGPCSICKGCQSKFDAGKDPTK